MEYYNLIGKENFEIYYRNKINGLLLNPEIMEYLDKNKNVKKMEGFVQTIKHIIDVDCYETAYVQIDK